jgi:hypothetical protein
MQWLLSILEAAPSHWRDRESQIRDLLVHPNASLRLLDGPNHLRPRRPLASM